VRFRRQFVTSQHKRAARSDNARSNDAGWTWNTDDDPHKFGIAGASFVAGGI
jgi:hypothetical protein